MGRTLDVASFKVYLDRVMREAGNPTDPVERMLLEQLVQAHHVIGGLHVRTSDHRKLGRKQNLPLRRPPHGRVPPLDARFEGLPIADCRQAAGGATSADKQTMRFYPADKKAEAATTCALTKQGTPRRLPRR